MIPIRRTPLEATLEYALSVKTSGIAAEPEATRASKARSSWNSSTAVRRRIRGVLERMAQGRNACMYCSDQFGTDVDHYEPLTTAPLKTWVWLNHLLACTSCNSRHKRSLFPVDANGEALFLDPTVDDPWDHLRLSPRTGLYRGITARGVFTAERLLNHELLARGRRAAWLDALDHIRGYDRAVAMGDSAEATRRQLRLLQRPNLDAFYAVLRYSELDGATAVIPSDVQLAIGRRRATFRAWIGLR